MNAIHILASPRIDDNPGVKLQVSANESVNELGSGLFASYIHEPPLIQHSCQLDLRVHAFSKFFEPSLDNREHLGVWRIGLGFFLASFFKVRTLISQRRSPREDALIDPCKHAIATALFSYGIIKLGDAGKESFKQFCDRFVADRFGYGVERDAVSRENFSDSEMVIGISRKPIHA